MYAVIETGGKQYRVQPGDIIEIEKLEGDVGSSVQFDRVLFLSKPGEEASQIWLGKPVVDKALVEGEVVGQGRGEKLLIIKMKRRKDYRRTQGHRQYLTQILVTGVTNGSGEKSTLSADQKKAVLTKFQSHLAPKGSAFSPKKGKTRIDTDLYLKRKAESSTGEAAPVKKAAKKTAGKKKAAATKKAAKKKAAKKKSVAKKKATKKK